MQLLDRLVAMIRSVLGLDQQATDWILAAGLLFAVAAVLESVGDIFRLEVKT